jgi:hypothetical protein
MNRIIPQTIRNDTTGASKNMMSSVIPFPEQKANDEIETYEHEYDYPERDIGETFKGFEKSHGFTPILSAGTHWFRLRIP